MHAHESFFFLMNLWCSSQGDQDHDAKVVKKKWWWSTPLS
jgi:hypothetical protein